MPPSRKSTSTHYDSSSSSDYSSSSDSNRTKQKMTWFIEVSNGNWTELPERYDTSRLWHIE
ncbi:MAG: hypothetical protein IKG93_10785 [Clostridiales bacterium]|nr:hypothetical protein [Clostridiales bacterium]